MQLAIMGPPGSGKTTVGRSISQNLNVPYISSGDIARMLADQDPTTALSLKSGAMAPEESMRALIKKQIENALHESGGFVIEGFPRTVAQYIALRMWGAMPSFIWLDLSEYGCLERLLLRAREDDTPDAIARRLQTYREETLPILRFVSEGHQVERIDAQDDIDAVSTRAEMVIARLLP